MKEINEKDLEQAAGGFVTRVNQKCDKYEPKDSLSNLIPNFMKNCSDCIHYTIYGKCGLQD